MRRWFRKPGDRHGNVLVAIESACTRIVERVFALIFPRALEPVQIARKLVAVFESLPPPRSGPRTFVVELAPADLAVLAPDRSYLEGRYGEMLVRLAAREDRPYRLGGVAIEGSARVPRGTARVNVRDDPEPSEPRAPSARLALRVISGVPLGGTVPLRGMRTVGRDPSCDLVVHDPRTSRRHLRVDADGERVRFYDLGSANGTFLDDQRREQGELRLGERLRIGDTVLELVRPDDLRP